MSDGPRCRCCHREMRGPHVQVVTAGGFTERLCRACCPHCRLNVDGGVTVPDVCPDARPEPRPALRFVAD